MHQTRALAPATFHAAYWARRHDYDRGALTGHAYWHHIAATSGAEVLSPEALQHLLDADVDLWTDLNQPMLAWAQSLQEQGIRTGILSNIGDAMQHGLEQKFPWLGRFHHRTWSHSLGTAKPDPVIYRHAAEGLDTPSQHILFLDDREENIAAARAAAMQTIHYTSWPAFLTDLAALGDTGLPTPLSSGEL